MTWFCAERAHSLTKLPWFLYRLASLAGENGTVVPNRMQLGTGVLPIPPNAAAGTPTCGLRTPPRVLPFASLANTNGDVGLCECVDPQVAFGLGRVFDEGDGVGEEFVQERGLA